MLSRQVSFEHLEELAASQVEHELRVNVEMLAETETCGVVFAVFGKLLAQSD